MNYSPTVKLALVRNDTIVRTPQDQYKVSYIGNYTLGSLSFDSVYKARLYAVADSGYVYYRLRVGLIRTEMYLGTTKRVYNLLRYQIQ